MSTQPRLLQDFYSFICKLFDTNMKIWTSLKVRRSFERKSHKKDSTKSWNSSLKSAGERRIQIVTLVKALALKSIYFVNRQSISQEWSRTCFHQTSNFTFHNLPLLSSLLCKLNPKSSNCSFHFIIISGYEICFERTVQRLARRQRHR